MGTVPNKQITQTEKIGKILYCLQWFPAVSETFILREILELQRQGEEIDVFSLTSSPDSIIHSEYSQFKGIVIQPVMGCMKQLRAHIFWLSRKADIYFSILFVIITKLFHYKSFTQSIKVFFKIIPLAYRLKDSNYRHIHAHFGKAPATGAWILSNLLDIPFSFTLHAVDVFLPDRLLVQKVSDAKFVAVISNFNIGYLKNRFRNIDSSKFHVVRCGINLDEFVFSQANKVNMPAKLLSVGRMVETKGFRDLLNAVAIIKQKGININLKIIGGGEKLDEFKALSIKLGISDMVSFTGSLEQNEVKNAMKESDLFVLPCSVNEIGDRDGIPVVLMESLALGIPTISTEISGIPELVKNNDTGLLVPQKNPELLANAIMLYLNNQDLRKQLPVNGRKLVEEEYNIEKNAFKLRELIVKKMGTVPNK